MTGAAFAAKYPFHKYHGVEGVAAVFRGWMLDSWEIR